MLSIILYGISITVLLYIFGYGLTLLTLPRGIKEHAIWLIPWFAIIALIFILVTMSLAGVSVSMVKPILIGVFVILDIFVIFRTSLRLEIVWKEVLIVVSVMAVIFTLSLLPLLRHDNLLTTISMGNNDPVIYAITSEYLVDHSIKDYFQSIPDSLKPGDKGVGNLLVGGYRWGTPILPAFFLSVFNLDGYQLEYLMQVILFIFCLPLFLVLLKVLYKISFIGKILGLVMFGLNTNLLYMLFHNFFGQVLFWGIELFFLIILYSYLTSYVRKKPNVNNYDIILGITIGVLYFSYHEAIIMIIVPLILSFILRFIFNKNLKNYWNLLTKILLIAGISSSFAAVHALKVDFFQASGIDAPIGWNLFRKILPYANPFEMMGFYSIHSYEPMPLLIAIVLSLLVISLIILGIIKSKEKLFTISLIIIYLTFYIWTAVLHHNFFAYNRAVTYSLPLLLILFTIGIDRLYKNRSKLVFIIIFLICLEIFMGFKLVRRFTRERIIVDKSLISLRELHKVKINEPIYTEQSIIGLQNYWQGTWTDYFLYPQYEIFTFGNFDYINKTPPDNSMVLLSKYNRYYKPAKIVLKNIIWQNEYYILGRGCFSDNCLLQFKVPLSSITFQTDAYEDSLIGLGWSLREDGHRWISGKKATLRLVAKDKPSSTLRIEAVSLLRPQTMTVYVNEENVGETSVGTDWEDYVFEIGQRSNEVIHVRLEFTKIYNPVRLGLSADPRDLTANIKKITLE